LKLAVAVCVKVGLPPVPVTVNVYVPFATVEETFTASADDPVAGLGLKVPLAPDGRPPTARVTADLKPAAGVIVTV
jgi:hypothetical protein